MKRIYYLVPNKKNCESIFMNEVLILFVVVVTTTILLLLLLCYCCRPFWIMCLSL